VYHLLAEPVGTVNPSNKYAVWEYGTRPVHQLQPFDQVPDPMYSTFVRDGGASSFTETGFIATGVGAHGLYPSRDGTKLYVANRGIDRVGGPPHRAAQVVRHARAVERTASGVRRERASVQQRCGQRQTRQPPARTTELSCSTAHNHDYRPWAKRNPHRERRIRGRAPPDRSPVRAEAP
jgi:hypothetical protein